MRQEVGLFGAPGIDLSNPIFSTPLGTPHKYFGLLLSAQAFEHAGGFGPVGRQGKIYFFELGRVDFSKFHPVK
jgi:hypothetical protein